MLDSNVIAQKFMAFQPDWIELRPRKAEGCNCVIERRSAEDLNLGLSRRGEYASYVS